MAMDRTPEGTQAAYQPPMAAQFPLKPPQAILAYEAIVDIAPTASLGMGPAGERRIVNILGGTFEGPTIHGKVLPGGADRQLLRPDGILQLDAFYEMETDDGAVITVRNSAKVDYRPDGSRYAFSTLDLTAPDGQHAWINRTVFVGTVDVMRPSREAVIIRVYQLA